MENTVIFALAAAATDMVMFGVVSAGTAVICVPALLFIALGQDNTGNG